MKASGDGVDPRQGFSQNIAEDDNHSVLKKVLNKTSRSSAD
jgi:hypothetical protein